MTDYFSWSLDPEQGWSDLSWALSFFYGQPVGCSWLSCLEDKVSDGTTLLSICLSYPCFRWTQHVLVVMAEVHERKRKCTCAFQASVHTRFIIQAWNQSGREPRVAGWGLTLGDQYEGHWWDQSTKVHKLKLGKKGYFKSKIQLIHIIDGFQICQFAYLLKSACDLRIKIGGFHSHSWACAEQWKIWATQCTGPKLRSTRPSCLNSHNVVNQKSVWDRSQSM